MSSSSFYSVSNPAPAEAISDLAAAYASYTAQLAALAPFQVVTDTWASTTAINWSTAYYHKVTLGGNTTFTFSAAPADGSVVILDLKQDGTGSRTISLPASVRYTTAALYYTPSTTAGYTDRLVFVYDAAAAKYDLTSVITGIH